MSWLIDLFGGSSGAFLRLAGLEPTPKEALLQPIIPPGTLQPPSLGDILNAIKASAPVLGIAGVTALAFGLAALSRRNGA
jgi:hypothetical protein